MPDRVVPVSNLDDFFRESIGQAIDNQHVHVTHQTSHYVVNLMTLFARSDALYEDDGETYGIRPLAMMMADAADAESASQRNVSLQRIGDVALFTAGFFAESLASKPVDIDYYVQMGGTAYGSLCDEMRGTRRGSALADVYRELAYKFQLLVDVLNEVRESAQGSSDDLVRTYEIWRKTGSKRAAARLRRDGVVPLQGKFRNH